MISQTFFRICAAILLGLFAFLSITSALRESLTYDEIVHIQEGKNAWLKHEFLVDTNNPPLIRELAVTPFLVWRDDALLARLVIVGLGVALGAGILLVASSYFGRAVGLFALFLYVFEPNTLAYSHYVTQDLGAALFFFLGYMSLVWLMHERSWRSFIIHGFVVGLMAASKITTLPYYIVSAALIVPFTLRGKLFSWFRTQPIQVLVSLLIFGLTIWSTYFFKTNVIIAPSYAKGRVSASLETIARKQNNQVLLNSLHFLRSTPVPLGDYVAVVKNTLVRSTKPAYCFYLGSFFSKSQWYFMVVNVFLKTPLPLMILFAFGLFLGLKMKQIHAAIWMFAIPIFSILFIASLSHMQPLVRYVLPLYPFLIIIAAYGFSYFTKYYQKIILLVLCLWYMVGSLNAYPHFISYANEFGGSKAVRYTKFLDSNIDWGQSLPDIKQYIVETKPSSVQFSYFGRDDASRYGLSSDLAYGSYKFNEICAFHDVRYPQNSNPSVTVISISNWRYCGYDLDPNYAKEKVKAVVGQSMFIF